MSGLLGRIAAQASGAAPAVRPRTRSRFEPSPGSAGGVQLVEVHEEISVRVPPTAPSAASPPARAPGSEKPPAIEPEGRRAAAQPSVAGHAGLPMWAPTPQRRVSERHVVDAASVLTPAPLAAPAPLSAGTALSGGAAPPTADPAATVRPAPRRVGMVGERRAEGDAAELPPLQRRRGLLVEPPARLPALRPEAAKTGDDRGVRSHDVAPQQPEIHVTIGRVEVRSPPPPAPARVPAPPPSPGLSLGDYLRGRADGSRR